MKICDSNRRVSAEVAAFLRNVSEVKEESITDYLVWKWREIDKRFKFLKIVTFTRQEEHTTTGADFELELWVVGTRDHIPMIVQAKKLAKRFDSYVTRLNYPSGTQGQLAKLLAYGRSKGLLPFYFFYSLPDSDTTAMCPCNDISNCGVFVADAVTIKDVADGKSGKKISKSALLGLSNPLHCMFCCPLFFHQYFRALSTQGFLQSNDQLPRYVHLLLSEDLRSIDQLQGEELARTPVLPAGRIVAAYDAREEFNEVKQHVHPTT